LQLGQKGVVAPEPLLAILGVVLSDKKEVIVVVY
jgi:hypothetical protein